jgi:AbrB family looped-hinge helix DNA binding protein
MEVVITRKGQITIPAGARKALGLKQGDKVVVSVEGDALKVERGLDWVERTRGIVKSKRPPLTPQEEDEVVAQAIVDDYEETLKRMEG